MAYFGGYSFTPISGGTNSIVVAPGPTIFRSVIFPGTYVGTIAFYDSATVAGTASGNQIISFGLPTTSVFQEINFNIACKNGLVYTATGTPLVTFTWGN